MPRAMRIELAMIVSVGLKPGKVGNVEASATKTLSTSCSRPEEAHTEVRGSSPMRAVPARCAV